VYCRITEYRLQGPCWILRTRCKPFVATNGRRNVWLICLLVKMCFAWVRLYLWSLELLRNAVLGSVQRSVDWAWLSGNSSRWLSSVREICSILYIFTRFGKYSLGDVHKYLLSYCEFHKDRPNVGGRHKFISVPTFHIYCSIWVKFRPEALQTLLLSSGDLHEGQRREGLAFLRAKMN
jgi:hypothetical protein